MLLQEPGGHNLAVQLPVLWFCLVRGCPGAVIPPLGRCWLFCTVVVVPLYDAIAVVLSVAADVVTDSVQAWSVFRT